jgi:hypothetical protein
MRRGPLSTFSDCLDFAPLRDWARTSVPWNPEHRPRVGGVEEAAQAKDAAMNLLVKTLLLLCIWDYRRYVRKSKVRTS